MSDGHIRVEHGAVRNGRDGHGWLPLVWVNGRSQGSTWAAHGHSREDAERLAREAALAEYARFVGDWEIEVCPREHT